MLAQAPTLDSHQSALLRALNRASNEKIVVYRLDGHTLGVASVAGGTWADKPYHVAVTGTHTQDVACDCPAGRNRRTCKHVAAAVFSRKYHVTAKRPEPMQVSPICSVCGMRADDPLHEVFCDA
jgi:hypothetical protein